MLLRDLLKVLRPFDEVRLRVFHAPEVKDVETADGLQYVHELVDYLEDDILQAQVIYTYVTYDHGTDSWVLAIDVNM